MVLGVVCTMCCCNRQVKYKTIFIVFRVVIVVLNCTVSLVMFIAVIRVEKNKLASKRTFRHYDE